MKFLVVDSSIAVKWLTIENEQFTKEADKILEDSRRDTIQLALPEVAKYEVGNALFKKKLSLNSIQEALKAFYSLPLKFITETIETAKITSELVSKYKITYYDASFITLAQKFGADLVTDNIKHQGKYKGKKVKIIPLKDYR